eukprot:12901556-Prorocentrum_lima.AAC.1
MNWRSEASNGGGGGTPPNGGEAPTSTPVAGTLSSMNSFPDIAPREIERESLDGLHRAAQQGFAESDSIAVAQTDTNVS